MDPTKGEFCMNKKQKKNLQRIIIALILVLILKLLPQFPTPVELVLYCIPYLVVGWDVLRKALLGIKNRQPFDECFLMAVATVGALCLGEFSESVAVMLFYQIGELFQSYAVGKSRKSISDLMDIRPDSANLETADGTVSTVDPDDVPIGSILGLMGYLVPPKAEVAAPMDLLMCLKTLQGYLSTGLNSTLNTAALTGESKPRFVHPGSEIISGCVNGDGLLKLRTTKLYGESTVAKILDMVENSSLKKARAENFITKFAHYYTPAVCIGALVLAILPPLVLDGAHNEHAARVLAATWKEEFPGRKAALVFAASADKHIREMIPVLREITGEWHLVPCTSPRIMPAEELAVLLAGLETGPVFIHSTLPDGLHAALASPLPALAAGSLFLLGDLKALLRHAEKRSTAQ